MRSCMRLLTWGGAQSVHARRSTCRGLIVPTLVPEERTSVAHRSKGTYDPHTLKNRMSSTANKREPESPLSSAASPSKKRRLRQGGDATPASQEDDIVTDAMMEQGIPNTDPKVSLVCPNQGTAAVAVSGSTEPSSSVQQQQSVMPTQVVAAASKQPSKMHPFFMNRPANKPKSDAPEKAATAEKPAHHGSTDANSASHGAHVGAGDSSSSSAAAFDTSSSSTAAASSAVSTALTSGTTASRVLEDEDVAEDAEIEDEDDDIPLAKLAKAPKAGALRAAVGVASAGYHPVKDAPWTALPGKPMPYSALVSVFTEVEGTTKRLEITAALTRLFRSIIALSPGDLLTTLYLCTNSLAPAYESMELGVGESILQKALAEATGRQVKDIKSDAEKREGDLGLVAESSRAMQKTLFGASTAALTVRGVFNAYKTIATESGKSSQEKKISTIKRMLVAATGAEAKYLVRGMLGKLRIGLAKQTVMVALAHAITLTSPLPPGVSAPSGRETYGPAERGAYPPVCLSRRVSDEKLDEAVEVLKQVYSELPSFDVLVPALLSQGIEGARKVCTLTPGVPVAPMLAKPTKGIGEVLTRFEGRAFTCEWKYDGERAQVHITPAGLRIFSRNSEDTTGKYPDIGLAIQEAMLPATDVSSNAGASSSSSAMDTSSSSSAPPIVMYDVPITPMTSCVLDGEAVAYEVTKGLLLPFQVLSTRARKDATMENIKVPVIYVAFDCLYLNGHSLIHKPLEERRMILRAALREVPGKFSFARSAESTDTEEIGVFLNDSVKGGCEGLMVKLLQGEESMYEPSKRSLNWLKLKKDYMDGLSDSLDLVPVAAWRGKGKRSGVYGAYLLACYDAESDEYQSVCKVGTGFSEEILDELTAHFNAKGCVVASKPRNVIVGDALADADAWFVPEDSEVWEVRAADLSLSPVHMGAVGKVDENRGVGLRFPRFLRRRDDKGPVDATSADQVCTMYRDQATVNNNGGGDDDEDD